MSRRINPQRLSYQNVHTPYSTACDDIYFQAEQGIEESTYVYLEGAGVQEAILGSAQKIPANKISAGEIGFGVGLNFLLTLKFFLEHQKPNQTLFYFSVERQPIFKEDLIELYSRFPELTATAKLFLDQYPTLVPGFHRLTFAGGSVVLVLMLGDALDCFSKLDAEIDHWYWDGFSPQKNPDAFSEPLFQQIVRLSGPGAQGASFTAAGWVRRMMEAAGFKITKRPGFANKRECIQARYRADDRHALKKSALPPWFSSEKLFRAKKGDRIAVVGAGLAGSAIAAALAERGMRVDVYDPNGIAKRASGNTAALFNIQLSKIPNPISRFSQLALVHFFRELKRRKIPAHYGILRTGSVSEVLYALEVAEYPSTFFQKMGDGLLFPECGFLSPTRLCEDRLSHPNIKLISRAIQDGSALKDEYDHIVYAIGADLFLTGNTLQHPLLSRLPLRAVRGQTLQVKPTVLSTEQIYTRFEQGYLTPVAPEVTGTHEHLLGATYQAKSIADDQETQDTQSLIAEAKAKFSPDFSENLVTSTRVGYRLSAPDKLPLIGPVYDEAWMRTAYQKAMRGSRRENPPPFEGVSGEWMLTGLSSRGVTFSSLGAEILACLMTGEALPIELDLWEHLHSARFFVRQLKKAGIS